MAYLPSFKVCSELQFTVSFHYQNSPFEQGFLHVTTFVCTKTQSFSNRDQAIKVYVLCRICLYLNFLLSSFSPCLSIIKNLDLDKAICT